MTNLTNKTALVTGASRGIGRATALALANAGAYVLVSLRKSQKDADTLVAAIRSGGGRADSVGGDLARLERPPSLSPKCEALLEIGSTCWSRTQASPKAGALRTTPSKTSTISLPPTCAPAVLSGTSSFFPFLAKAPA